MSAKIRKALCCECGEIRTCHRPRNYQHENYFLGWPIDRNWHRELGDLKCTNCGRVTRHAILRPEGDSHRDHAERITRIALGCSDPCKASDVDRIRQAYRQGRQVNPYLKHLWSNGDEEVARKAGKTTVVTYCGEVQKIPAESRTRGGTEQLRPDPVRWDQEYEDPETGAWWIEMDCPDCYRVVNDRRMAERRALLRLWLVTLAENGTERVSGSQVESLLAALKAAQGGAS